MSLTKYTWKFYLTVAHLVDEQGHTACSRGKRKKMHFDEPDAAWDGESNKCATCELHFKKFGLKFRGTEQ